MTYRVNFYADQAFFSMIKRILENGKLYDQENKLDFEAEETATSIIICHSACEAFLNLFANEIQIENFSEYERKSILDRIEILYEMKGRTVDWTKLPYQDIRSLDKSRNWLTHFKKSDIGLISSNGLWVVDSFNKRPKIDDASELNYKRIERYYKQIRIALLEIAKLYGMELEFYYLENESYNSCLIG